MRKCLVDEMAGWCKDELMKQLADEVASWWNDLMKWLNEMTGWRNVILKMTRRWND